ncbi:MAG TPA: ribosome small subunit-dependent GTPase A [Paenalcaligenes sp.]|nr:ribosome small subunit-dependent GTPase A [Paenalcaligenes sp.]
MSTKIQRLEARVIASFGRNFIAQCLESGNQYRCYTRGKRTDVAVGDYVQLSPQGDEQAAIEKIHVRRNLLYRSDNQRSKRFAANIDGLFFVVAPAPDFSMDLAGRAFIAAKNAGVAMQILLNKADLPAAQAAKIKLQPLQALGIPILTTSIHDPQRMEDTLRPLLMDRTVLLLGQSAMGKSSILNVLIPDAQAQTREHSQALGAGRHTTTDTRLYALADQSGYLIDSPGFQAFGLAHLEREELLLGFPDLHEAMQNCQFYNCTHRHEPNCGVLKALENEHIDEGRYQLYTRIMAEYDARPRY